MKQNETKAKQRGEKKVGKGRTRNKTKRNENTNLVRISIQLLIFWARKKCNLSGS